MPALLSALATTAALTWTGPVALPATTTVLDTVATPGGGALVVSGTSYAQLPYTSKGTLTVQRMDAAGALSPGRTLPDRFLVRDRPRPDGGDDLLVWRPDPRHQLDGRLAVVRVSADGTPRTLWTAPDRSGTTGDLARDAHGRYVVTWTRYDGTTSQLRIATSKDGRHWSAARSLRRHGRAVRAQVITSLGAALDRRGTPVVVASQFGATTIYRARARDGAIVSMQASKGVGGLIRTAQNAQGRVAVVVHDTGIEGEFGECVGDGHPRQVFATVADAQTGRFAPMATLGSQRAYCPDGGAPVLLSLPAGRFAVVFGTLGDAGQKDAAVKVAVAGATTGFAPPAALWPGSELADAVADPRDGTLVVALQAPDPAGVSRPSTGVAIATRTPDGTLTPAQPLTGTGAASAMSVARDGHVVLDANGGLFTGTP